MAQLFANNAKTVLLAGINSSATSLSVPSGKGGLFPLIAAGSGDFFYVTLTQAATETTFEIVKVTARSADTMTIVRGQQGTSAAAWAALDKVELRWTRDSVSAQVPIGGLMPFAPGSDTLITEGGSRYLRTGYLLCDPTAPSAIKTIATNISYDAHESVALGSDYRGMASNGAGVLVAVAYSNSNAMRSIDYGLTWTAITLPANSSWGYWNVIWDGTKFIAGASYNNKNGAYSVDGLTWTAMAMTTVNAGALTLVQGPGIIVGLQANSGTWPNVYSVDGGLTWNPLTMPSSKNYSSVKYGNGVFFACDSTTTAHRSTDGINWTQVTVPGSFQTLGTDGSGRWVALASNDSWPWYSTDGCLTWVKVSSGTPNGYPHTYQLLDIGWNGYCFVATSSSHNIVSVSVDGINWTHKTTLTRSSWTEATVLDNMLYIWSGSYVNLGPMGGAVSYVGARDAQYAGDSPLYMRIS